MQEGGGREERGGGVVHVIYARGGEHYGASESSRSDMYLWEEEKGVKAGGQEERDAEGWYMLRTPMEANITGGVVTCTPYLVLGGSHNIYIFTAAYHISYPAKGTSRTGILKSMLYETHT